jgi:hypothetical protein
MARKQLRWSASPPRPIMVQDGLTLQTLHDVRTFMLALPEATQSQQSWHKAAELLLAAFKHAGVAEALT